MSACMRTPAMSAYPVWQTMCVRAASSSSLLAPCVNNVALHPSSPTQKLRDTCIAERGEGGWPINAHTVPARLRQQQASCPGPRLPWLCRAAAAATSTSTPCCTARQPNHITAGEEHAYCQSLIEAHKACLRVEGFAV